MDDISIYHEKRYRHYLRSKVVPSVVDDILTIANGTFTFLLTFYPPTRWLGIALWGNQVFNPGWKNTMAPYTGEDYRKEYERRYKDGLSTLKMGRELGVSENQEFKATRNRFLSEFQSMIIDEAVNKIYDLDIDPKTNPIDKIYDEVEHPKTEVTAIT